MWSEANAVECPLGTFSALAFSRDDSLLAAGTTKGWVYLYQLVPTSVELNRAPIHSKGINHIRFSKDESHPPGKPSNFLLTCSDDATVVLRRVADLSNISSYHGSLDGLLCCDISPQNDQIIAAGLDTMLHLWAATSDTQLTFASAHTDVITSVHFNATADFAITSSLDGLCRIWSVKQMVVLKTFFWRNMDSVMCARFLPSEFCFLAAGSDSVLRIVDILENRVIGQCVGHSNDETPMSIHFCTRRQAGADRIVELIVPSDDGSVKCWDFATQKPLWQLQVGRPDIVRVALAGDGEMLATSCVSHRTLRVWKRR
jgi:WD40 repeat protein